MNILSLFDGISTGLYCFDKLGICVENYYAYEIDKNAIKCSKANWGDKVTQCGDVFDENFTKYEGNIDFLIGGSPCTFWSICQKNNRETEASGLGWDLFSQYVRALKQAKPKYFIYENNQSMHENIRKSICETFGFEQVEINAALVSAQNRRRYYWVGKRNEDGTYSKVDVSQPEDRGILLKDIIDGMPTTTNKCYGIGYRNRREQDGKLHRRYETHGEQKSNCMTTVGTDYMIASEIHINNNSCIQVGALPRPNGELSKSQAFRIYSVDGKSVTLKAGGGGCGGKTGLYAIPVSEDEASELSDRQCFRIYEVKDGKVFVRGRQYSIRLDDGFYWIRDLTVKECCRLQTMPDDYCDMLPKTVAQKALGNGWCAEVIVHLIRAAIE